MRSALVQDRWLRFLDAAREAEFHAERQESALPRVRRAVLAFTVIVVGLGLSEWLIPGQTPRDVVARLLAVRFGFIVPLWLLYVGLTHFRWPPERLELLSATCIVLSSLAFNYLVWEVVRALPKVDLSETLLTTSLLTLVASVLLVPLRFRLQAVVTLLSTAAPALGFALFLPEARPGQVQNGLLNLSATALALLLVGRWREAAERRSFAQRVELAEANAELARLQRAQTEFLVIAAHDLRSPLAAVRGLADLLAAGRLSEEQIRLTGRGISEQAQRMLALVSTYLEEQGGPGGRLLVELRAMNCSDALTAAVRRHAPNAQTKGIELRAEIPAFDPLVRADPALLGQALDQFVGNAIKFCPPGAKVVLSHAQSSAGAVRLEVRDDGPGVEAEALDRLFEPGERAGSQPTGEETSYGLGLAIARRLIEAQGGRVGCARPSGGGACFWIELRGTTLPA